MECLDSKPVKKLIRSKSGLRIVVTDDFHKSPFVIGEPQWTPDKEVSKCTKCSAKFGFTTRKHHCRRCGNIYCSACSDEKLDLPRMCFVDPVRICSDCAPTTIQENKFFECQLKILTGGASFLLENRSDEKLLSDSSDNLVLCKLSQDHRCLMFEPASVSDANYNDTLHLLQFHPLHLHRIRSLRVYNNLPTAVFQNEDTITGSTSIEMECTSADSDNFDDQKITDLLRLSTPTDGQSHKQSVSWILAMQQAFKMLYGDHQQNCNEDDTS
ncbi:zinc finger FYVE domain-containing protein 21-like isoform X1 [Lycorma delicatula]|uniref:zinc finger FYVE domain-containing protein 21-like isoform X1 n=1 Tax=Lycorma delicatula TaxID=130591 RepID=UPI003F516D79